MVDVFLLLTVGLYMKGCIELIKTIFMMLDPCMVGLVQLDRVCVVGSRLIIRLNSFLFILVDRSGP